MNVRTEGNRVDIRIDWGEILYVDFCPDGPSVIQAGLTMSSIQLPDGQRGFRVTFLAPAYEDKLGSIYLIHEPGLPKRLEFQLGETSIRLRLRKPKSL